MISNRGVLGNDCSGCKYEVVVIVVVIEFLPLEIDGVPTPLIRPRKVLIPLLPSTEYNYLSRGIFRPLIRSII